MRATSSEMDLEAAQYEIQQRSQLKNYQGSAWRCQSAQMLKEVIQREHTSGELQESFFLEALDKESESLT